MSELYTEEQVNRIANQVRINGFWNSQDFTPIQLPTDEEIDEYIKSFPYTKHLDDGQYNDGVIVGAELAIEWMRDKIKGGQDE